jgi:hypothetical protein
VDKYKGLRDLVEKIVAITGVDAIDFDKLKDTIIELAYEIDRVDKEDR